MGLFSSLVNGMTAILNWFYNLTVTIGIPSYGLAIILITVAVKLILYPLTHSQMKSMRAMQQLQPKIKEIQDKYKGKDPQKMQQAMMELYKEHKVNPMSGCLPILIQMPVLIALYRALLQFHPLNPSHAWFLWVNLGQKDPYFILPVLAGLTTYLQTRLTTNTTDPTQRTMLYMMPVFIAWISSTVPAGLALYWVIFNLLGALQQYYINKKFTPVGEGVAYAGNRKER